MSAQTNAAPSTERTDVESEPDEPELEIVIVTYGRADLVSRCLASVREFAPAATRTYVVDNNSPDDTASVVAEQFPEVELIARSTNDGFGVANNIALAKVTAPFVLVLNPDTELEANTLAHLLTVMREQPEIGVLGCRLITDDGTLDHAAKRAIPTPSAALKYFMLRALGRTGSDYVAPEVNEFGTGEVGAVNGAFMLIRTAAMRQVGLFDEEYWMYAEDLDWCVRFKEAGWMVWYDGTVTAHHVKGASAGSARSLKLNYHFHRSMAIFVQKHQRSRNELLNAAVIGGIWTRFALVAMRDGVRRAWARRRA